MLLFLLFLFCGSATAQSESATLSGRVTDPTGAAVVGAQVVLTNMNTDVEQRTKTNREGIYVFASVQPGPYRVAAGSTGFKTLIKENLVLHTQDEIAENFSLSLGSVSESVTVNASVISVNTTDAAVGTVVDRTFVENIPLNGRSFQDLISMTPGVVTQSPNESPGVGGGGDFSVNGQRTESNYYTVDGVSANVAAGNATGNLNLFPAGSGSVPAGTALGTTQSLISVDALQEFRVQSSTYSAEYGGGPGGQISLVTRSGTNEFHGSAFDYIRNDFFDANDWFNDSLGVPKSALRQNDFGGTLGGPVLIPGLYDGKDKTFFFVSYEGLRLTQPQAATTGNLVPDTFMREQAPAALQAILNAFPLQSPNSIDYGTPAAPSLAQFISAYSVPSEIDSTSVRLDHTFGPKLSLFFRFGDTPSSVSTRGSGGAQPVLTQESFNAQTYTLGAVSQLSNRVTNDFHLGYARSHAQQTASLDNFGGATPINLAAALGATSSTSGFLIMDIIVPGAGVASLVERTARDRLRQWNVVDTLSISSGHHQFKFGVDYRRIASPTAPANPTIAAIFLGAQQVLSNLPLEVEAESRSSATPVFNETAAFVQDEWHVRSRLNLSLGLRWELDPAPHGANGEDAYTLLGSIQDPSTLALAPLGTPLWKTTWFNFAPRLGLAWTVGNSPGWETVVRTGGGVFFDTNNQPATSGFTGVGFGATAIYTGLSLPLTPAQVYLTPSVTPPFSSNVYAFPSHLQEPYTLQWNVALQQVMGTKQSLTLSYVGAAGRRMTGRLDLAGIAAFNPDFSNVSYFTTGLTSDYDAFQAQFQRSISHGIQALASYTWSHCIDFGSAYGVTATAPGIGRAAFIRGNCDMDVRHNFQGGVTWDLPGVSGNKLERAVVNHWGLDTRLIARTGFPVTLFGSSVLDPATGGEYDAGLNVVPNEPIYLYGPQYPGGRSINPNAFCDPSLGPCPGSAAPRNFVRGFGEWQINMAVRREFPINERLRLQFRAEAFNILNHPNFGYVDQNLPDATFGQAVQMLNQSLATVASQYQQGGPRSMQFALKLLF